MDQLLDNLFKEGNLAEIQTLYAENPDIITDYEMFPDALNSGYLDVVHWLFRAACIDGHLHIMQWLLQVKPDIDISDRSETVFRFACDLDHLHIAKWLIQVKPDIKISAYRDLAFRCACFEDRKEIAQWLYQIRPYRYSLKLNDNNQIIHCGVRPLTERKWLERCEPLMAHYSKKEENQNNIFRHLPKEVVRNICEFV